MVSGQGAVQSRRHATRAHASRDVAVYAFGLALTGLPGLPATRLRPAVGADRSAHLHTVDPREIAARWRSSESQRLIERRRPDGRLVLAVDRLEGVGYRVNAPDVGLHLVDESGTQILITRPLSPPWLSYRVLFGQTLPIAAALQGLAAFHAGAVELGGHAFALSAPSGTGKTSTAIHLLARGAGFVTDDTLAVELIGDTIHGYCGPELSAVAPHELEAVAAARLGTTIDAPEESYLLPRARSGSLPFAALYMLQRTMRPGTIEIVPLEEEAGTATLLGSGVVPHVDGPARLLSYLTLCGRLLTEQRVFRLRIPASVTAADVAVAVENHAATGGPW